MISALWLHYLFTLEPFCKHFGNMNCLLVKALKLPFLIIWKIWKFFVISLPGLVKSLKVRLVIKVILLSKFLDDLLRILRNDVWRIEILKLQIFFPCFYLFWSKRILYLTKLAFYWHVKSFWLCRNASTFASSSLLILDLLLLLWLCIEMLSSPPISLKKSNFYLISMLFFRLTRLLSASSSNLYVTSLITLKF